LKKRCINEIKFLNEKYLKKDEDFKELQIIKERIRKYQKNYKALVHRREGIDFLRRRLHKNIEESRKILPLLATRFFDAYKEEQRLNRRMDSYQLERNLKGETRRALNALKALRERQRNTRKYLEDLEENMTTYRWRIIHEYDEEQRLIRLKLEEERKTQLEKEEDEKRHKERQARELIESTKRRKKKIKKDDEEAEKK